MLGPAAPAGDDRSMFAFAVIAVALTAASPGSEAAAWHRLQSGMNAVQVTETLGVPLLRHAARGHELWVYDDGANVQFAGGGVTAWTQPTPRPAPRPTARPSSPAAMGPARRTAPVSAPANGHAAGPDSAAKRPTLSARIS
jgi:hypothetical protein